MKAEKSPVILTIDDETVIRDSIRAYLEDYDYTVLEAENGRIGLEIHQKEEVDLILVDLRMPEVDGLEVLSEIRTKSPNLPIIVVSGTGEIADVVEALRLGAWDYLLKPITDMSILIHSIEKGLERARLLEENTRYHENLEELVELKTRELSCINTRLKKVVESTKKLLGCGLIEESGALLLKEFGYHMDASGGSIYKVTHDGLENIASLGDNNSVELISFPLKEGSVFAKVLQDQEPLFLADIDDDDSIIPSGGRYKNHSFLVFPLADVNDNVLAVISLHSKKNPPYVSQDMDIGKILISYTCEALQVAKVSAALKSSEERLQQAQKMEAIGTLAGGIAHDFNNILAAIIGYTDLSLFSGSCDGIVRKNLEQVKKAGNRAKDLVAQILAFSRIEESAENAVDIGPIIKEAIKFLRVTIPSSIAIDYDVPYGLGKVLTDPTRIYQVLMNLCTNAAHAMQTRDGALTVCLDKVEEKIETLEESGKSNSLWLRLSVADTGEGMDTEMLNRIFDPYFTTKEQGEGTGLGLSVVHGIVRANGGTIRVESKAGVGSTFHLYFPCVQETHDVMEEASLLQMTGGNERILFVDDETTLADMAGEMLENLGYTVNVLSSSASALALFRQKPENFDLLITDLTMPGISGMDLASEVLSLSPDLPVILYTGYSATIDGEEARRVGIREFLMKPLSMNVLAEAVRKTLDGENKGN